jgi:hypothetical protein
MKHLTNVWRCSKCVHTMRLSGDFVWRFREILFGVVRKCFTLYRILVSQMFDVVSQRSHGQNLTKISRKSHRVYGPFIIEISWPKSHKNITKISSCVRAFYYSFKQRQTFVRFCSTMFHDVWSCFMLFHDIDGGEQIVTIWVIQTLVYSDWSPWHNG